MMLKGPLTVEEIRGELSLRFERLNSTSMDHGEGEVLEEQALFSGKFNGKCRNCGQIGHKSFQCKNRGINNSGKNVNSSGGNFCSYCRKKNCFKLKKKEPRNYHPSNYNSNDNRQNYESQDAVLLLLRRVEH